MEIYIDMEMKRLFENDFGSCHFSRLILIVFWVLFRELIVVVWVSQGKDQLIRFGGEIKAFQSSIEAEETINKE